MRIYEKLKWLNYACPIAIHVNDGVILLFGLVIFKKDIVALKLLILFILDT